MDAAALQDQLKVIFEGMPRDLQQTMLSSPHRAALLQGPGSQIKARLSDTVTSMSNPVSAASHSACFAKLPGDCIQRYADQMHRSSGSQQI